jgi:hypothetical protein
MDFEASDDARGKPLFSGTGEKAYVYVAFNVTNNCNSPAELSVKQSNGTPGQVISPEGQDGRTVGPEQTLKLQWWIGGADQIYLFCNGLTGGDGCTAEVIDQVYYDQSPFTREPELSRTE